MGGWHGRVFGCLAHGCVGASIDSPTHPHSRRSYASYTADEAEIEAYKTALYYLDDADYEAEADAAKRLDCERMLLLLPLSEADGRGGFDY